MPCLDRLQMIADPTTIKASSTAQAEQPRPTDTATIETMTSSTTATSSSINQSTTTTQLVNNTTNNNRRFDSAESLSGYSSSVGSNNSFLEDEHTTSHDDETLTVDTLPVKVIYQQLEVEMLTEENLTATDLCHLLVLKLSLEKTVSYELLLRLRSADIERPLEGDEEVAPLCRQYAAYMPVLELQRSRPSRWAFFDEPAAYVPLDMIEYKTITDKREKLTTLHQQLHYADKLQATFSAPVKFSQCQLSDKKFRENSTPELVTGKDFLATMSDNVIALIDQTNGSKVTIDASRVDVFVDAGAADSLTLHFVDHESSSVKSLSAANAGQKSGWLIAARIARRGLKNLRRLARSHLKSRAPPTQAVSTPTTTSSAYLEMEGKAYIDYSGAGMPRRDSGRNQRRSSSSDNRDRSYSMSSNGSTNSTVGSPTKMSAMYHHTNHLQPLHPWYYPELGREEASRLLARYLSVNGVFLVRNSGRAPGSYVLSFVHHGKISHMMIQRIDADCLSLDCGRTRFYDLQQLVEFYQLNLGLPVKLTHFVVQHL